MSPSATLPSGAWPSSRRPPLFRSGPWFPSLASIISFVHPSAQQETVHIVQSKQGFTPRPASVSRPPSPPLLPHPPFPLCRRATRSGLRLSSLQRHRAACAAVSRCRATRRLTRSRASLSRMNRPKVPRSFPTFSRPPSIPGSRSVFLSQPPYPQAQAPLGGTASCEKSWASGSPRSWESYRAKQRAPAPTLSHGSGG